MLNKGQLVGAATAAALAVGAVAMPAQASTLPATNSSTASSAAKQTKRTNPKDLKKDQFVIKADGKPDAKGVHFKIQYSPKGHYRLAQEGKTIKMVDKNNGKTIKKFPTALKDNDGHKVTGTWTLDSTGKFTFHTGSDGAQTYSNGCTWVNVAEAGAIGIAGTVVGGPAGAVLAGASIGTGIGGAITC